MIPTDLREKTRMSVNSNTRPSLNCHSAIAMLSENYQRKLSTLVLSDPISQNTEEKRKNVLLVASASILLTVYNLKINKTPWLDIEVPSGAPGILNGALALALVYTFLIFLLHTWTDLHRWILSREFIKVHGYAETINRTHGHMTGLHITVSAMAAKANEPNAGDSMKNSIKGGLAAMDELIADIQRLRRSHITLSSIQIARLAIVDIGTPIILALFALYKIGPAIPAFFSTMFK